MRAPEIHGVILAGGRGVRLWPLSRESRGKQFLPLAGERSLLRATAERLAPLTTWERILVVLEESQCEAAARELPELAPEQLLAEPARRNTAAAVALAAFELAARSPEGVMVVAPADHAVTDAEAFLRTVAAAAAAAEQGALVTLGLRPSRPETGYGYIEVGPPLAARLGVPVHRALSFVEKPPLDRARALVAGGRHLWNSGLFVWRVSAILDALRRYLPALHEALDRALSAGPEARRRELARAYQGLEAVSIDVGVMEKAGEILVVPGEFGWSDLGSWRSLDEIWPADADGNRVRGEVLSVDARGVTVVGGDRLVALVGLRDLVVVDTPDALLVCSKEKAQEVRELVSRLQKAGHPELR